MTNFKRRAAKLADHLVATRALCPGAWRDAFAAVPRHVFLPRFFRLTADGRHEAIDSKHPDWLNLVYQNTAWPTQISADPTGWERAHHNGPIVGEPTSSSTMPSLMASMLEALNIRDGHRVLEVGTGTGYNAAVMTHRLGDKYVTSVDIDPVVVARASDALAETGYRPSLALANGLNGFPPQAPYDRILVTCAVPEISTAWITQAKPDAVILAYLYRGLGEQVPVRLTVQEHGRATGHLLPNEERYGFMPARGHGIDPAKRFTELTRTGKHAGGYTRAAHHDLSSPALWLACLFTPGVCRLDVVAAGEEEQVWLFDSDNSWACLHPQTMTVEQGGPSHLWTRIETVLDMWHDLGKPERERFGLTVKSNGAHQLWLDGQGAGRAWELPRH